MLRLASTHYILSLDKDVKAQKTWKPVLEIFADADPDEIKRLENDTEAVLKKLLLDPANQNCLRVIINKARENARGAQDHITKEVWEEVNQMYHLVNQDDLLPRIDDFLGLEVMEPLIRHTVFYAGITDITMPRGTGWWFMNLGKFIERCLQTISFSEKQLELSLFHNADLNDILQWKYLLFSLSGYELHLKTYRTANHNYNVFHQVLINENFTRSVVYSMQRIEHYLEKITQHDQSGESGALLRGFGRLYSRVRFIEPDALNHVSLAVFLREIKMELLEFNRRVVQHFFSYA
jgi:uncharacterized alpha-E superfamily protein